VTVKSSEAIVPILRLGISEDHNIQSKAVWALALIASNQGGSDHFLSLDVTFFVCIIPIPVRSQMILFSFSFAFHSSFFNFNHNKTEGNIHLMNCLPGSWVLIKKLSSSKTTIIQWGIATILGFLSLYRMYFAKLRERKRRIRR
jgi:hypothetical protein